MTRSIYFFHVIAPVIELNRRYHGVGNDSFCGMSIPIIVPTTVRLNISALTYFGCIDTIGTE